MIKEFKSVKDIVNKIEIDIKSGRKHRYAARFIILYSYDQLHEFLDEVKFIKTMHCLDSGDIPLFDDVLINLEKSKEKHICLPYITELLRIDESHDLNTRLITLCDIAARDSLQTLVIPIVGLETSLLKGILTKLESSGRYPAIFQAPRKDYTKIKLIRLRNIEWLDLGEFAEEIILQPDLQFLFTLSTTKLEKVYLEIRDPNWNRIYSNFIADNLFLKEEITSIQDWIRHRYGCIIDFDFIHEHMGHWKTLYEELSKSGCTGFSEDQIVCKILNVKELNTMADAEFLSMCHSLKNSPHGQFKTWLIANHICSGSYPNISEYLKIVLIKALSFRELSFDELIYWIWLSIFDHENKRNYVESRKKMLIHVHDRIGYPTRKIEGFLADKLKTCKDLSLLTNITDSELCLMCESFANQSEEKIVADIQAKGIELLGYYLGINNLTIEALNDSTGWIKDYIYQYGLSKLSNQKTQKLSLILDEKNQSKDSIAQWYSSFRTVSALISEHKDLPLVWIDGLGVEWLAYIANLFLCSDEYQIQSMHIARTEIPTITKMNRIDDTLISVKELDQFIHSQNPYKYPDSLVQELLLVKRLVEDIKCQVGKQSFMIVSDHGFTFLSQRQYGVKKTYNYVNCKHEGRYAEVDTSARIPSSADYTLFDNVNKKFLIATKHVSLCNTPSNEVHGGFTPEEALVPVLIMRNKERLQYSITYPKSISVKGKLLISLMPMPKKVEIVLDGSSYRKPLTYSDGEWLMEVSGLMPKKYIAKLIIDNSNENDIDFEITASMQIKTMEEMFND